MKNKALHLKETGTRNSTGWLRAMRRSTDPEEAQFKDARRLSRVFPWLDDWDNLFERLIHKKLRSWKDHSKCRHQWERHEFPVIEYSTGTCMPSYLAEDHNRRWILERLRQEKTYVFNSHHDDCLYDVLDFLFQEGVCTAPCPLENGFYEVALVENAENCSPLKKKSR